MQHRYRNHYRIALTLWVAVFLFSPSVGHTEAAVLYTGVVNNLSVAQTNGSTQIAAEIDQKTACTSAAFGYGKKSSSVIFKTEDPAARTWFTLLLMAKELKHPVQIQYDKTTCAVVYVNIE